MKLKHFLLWLKIIILTLLAIQSNATARSLSSADKLLASQISDSFFKFSSMQGTFTQFNPNGQRLTGKFYLSRPGKIKFVYTNAPLEIIADGEFVAIHNKQLHTWNLYPLNETPLSVILQSKIDFTKANLTQINHAGNFHILIFNILNPVGTTSIQLAFNRNTFELQQWTLVAPNKQVTSIVLSNVKTGVKLSPSLFTIDYKQIQALQGKGKK